MMEYPKTIDEAINILISKLNIVEKEEIRICRESQLVLKFHHTIGATIRKEFGLNDGNEKLKKETDKTNLDEISIVILKALWKKLQK